MLQYCILREPKLQYCTLRDLLRACPWNGTLFVEDMVALSIPRVGKVFAIED